MLVASGGKRVSLRLLCTPQYRWAAQERPVLQVRLHVFIGRVHRASWGMPVSAPTSHRAARKCGRPIASQASARDALDGQCLGLRRRTLTALISKAIGSNAAGTGHYERNHAGALRCLSSGRPRELPAPVARRGGPSAAASRAEASTGRCARRRRRSKEVARRPCKLTGRCSTHHAPAAASERTARAPVR